MVKPKEIQEIPLEIDPLAQKTLIIVLAITPKAHAYYTASNKRRDLAFTTCVKALEGQYGNAKKRVSKNTPVVLQPIA